MDNSHGFNIHTNTQNLIRAAQSRNENSIIPNGSITTEKIADSSVTTDKLATQAVTSSIIDPAEQSVTRATKHIEHCRKHRIWR
jgi:hypothetical protein